MTNITVLYSCRKMADEAVNEDRRILGMYQLDFLENGRNRILLDVK